MPLTVLCRPNDHSIRNHNAKVCTHEHCRRVSQEIIQSLNESVNPCDNFYDYSCGSWIKRHSIPKERNQFSAIGELNNNNEKLLIDALETDDPTDTPTLKKVKNFYRSCLDTKTIDRRGTQPALQFIRHLHSWALAEDGSWNPKKWDFYDTLKLIHKTTPAEIFFVVDVIPNPVKHDKTKKEVIMVSVQLSSSSIKHFVMKTESNLAKRATGFQQSLNSNWLSCFCLP